MNINKIKDELQQKGVLFFENEDLKKHNSIKIGGVAKLFVVPKTEQEFLTTLDLTKKHKVKYQILANGTNTLFDDKTFDGIVISTKKLKNYYIKKEKICCQCGLGLFELGKICRENGLGGIEFCYGIPGSIGAGMITNAGAFENNIGNFVESVRVYKNGKIFELSKKDLAFDYRTSVLENSSSVILTVSLKLKKMSAEKIQNLQQKYFSKKVENQPYDKLSLGSVFKRTKNMPPISKLIDDLGLKGYTIGDVSVSKKHAGFLINNGHGTCKDFLLLIQYIQQKIFESYGFVPQLEIKFAGDFDATVWRLSHTHNL